MNNHEPPTHLGFASSAAAPPRLLHPVNWRASAIRRVCLRNHHPQQSYIGRGRMWFFGSDLHDYSLAPSSSSPRLVYLFVGSALRVTTFNANSIRPIVIFKEPQVMYGSSSRIMSYIFNMLICVDIILLDNLLQYLLFIVIIDLSRTCCTTATLIYNALVIFIIYPWIKLKLKVLIFSTTDHNYTIGEADVCTEW
jgi:hypothetical protein